MDQNSHSISVIIPALNEEKQLPSLLHYLFKETRERPDEVIVVDGRSTDRTVQVSRRAGARVVIASERSRANQMNLGGKRARGSILYFLHSDTYPPPQFVSQIRQAVNSGYPAGCYRLGFDRDNPVLRFYSWFTQFDLNAFRYGDQSLYVEANLFESVGGFDETLLLMEDNECISRLKRAAPFKIMNDSVVTSARRYVDNGVIRLQLLFTLIYTLYHLNVSQEVLVDIYRSWIN